MTGFIIGVLLVVCIVLFIYGKNAETSRDNHALYIKELRNELQKILSQKKSSEVRVGQITENLAPFLKNFKYDPKKCHFLGQPIDYIVYEEDEVIFIEVKTGEAKLSSKQRKIRDNIKNGNVRFEEFRVK
jgi:predicted Holliday junction resolvase-like endonuclease